MATNEVFEVHCNMVLHWDGCPYVGQLAGAEVCPVCTPHETHRVDIDYPLEGEPVMWCEDCCVTLWYVDSGVVAD